MTNTKMGLIAAALAISSLYMGDNSTRLSYAQEGSGDSSPLTLRIHDSFGFTSRSENGNREIRFLPQGGRISLLFTNTSKDELVLWQFECPEGDKALWFEIKLGTDSKVGIVRPDWDYTGGMGVPKTMVIKPGDTFIYAIDFASYWSLPLELKKDSQVQVLFRAVYAPEEQSGEQNVWSGRIETDWEAMTIANASGADVPAAHLKGPIDILK